MAVEFELEQTVHAPRDEVFQALIDTDRFPEWLPGCTELEKLTEGPVGEGTRWRETRIVMKKEATEEFLVKSLDEPNSISLYCDGSKGSTGRGEYFFDYELTERGGATAVRLLGKIDMGGFFFNLFAKLMKGMFVSQIKKDMVALDAYLTDGQSEE